MTKDYDKQQYRDQLRAQLCDIEAELKYYENSFNDKHVFCNFNDTETSNFWRYFSTNFKRLNLKQLTATSFSPDGSSYRLDIYKHVPNEIKNSTSSQIFDDTELLNVYRTPLKGNGDFQSDECIAILEECDIVVTYPPTPLMNELSQLLLEYQKDFVLMSNEVILKFSDFITLFKENKIWVGQTTVPSDGWMIVPEGLETPGKNKIRNSLGQELINIQGICWFTNLDNIRRHIELPMFMQYTPDSYPRYKNYKAININKIKEIPYDYYEAMGVPVSFLKSYNPDQFQILSLLNKKDAPNYYIPGFKDKGGRPWSEDSFTYVRLLIKRKL